LVLNTWVNHSSPEMIEASIIFNSSDDIITNLCVIYSDAKDLL
jgi:hypothetical protein